MQNTLQQINVSGRLLTPSKIICVGRNYVDHIKELNNEVPENMVVFLKPNSAIGNELQSYHQEPLHYEGELCFVYENGRFSAAGFGLDITKRQLQGKLKSKGLPWERAKAFDGAALFAPFTEITDIHPSLTVQLDVNGKTIQSGNISLMMYKPEDILAELKTFMTLNNGDIVMTGTPKGVGTIRQGDTFTGRVLINNSVISSAKWCAK